MDRQLREGRVPANRGVSSFLHVADAASAVVSALKWPTDVYNVVDDEPAAACEWVPALARALGAPVPAVSQGGESWERGAVNEAARSLGWLPSTPDWRRGFAALGI